PIPDALARLGVRATAVPSVPIVRWSIHIVCSLLHFILALPFCIHALDALYIKRLALAVFSLTGAGRFVLEADNE
ncbi:MAG: hypothetical protein SF123_05710, partial [Chloroflexota bacterium]|nr:hypothetical protein [Chloroflexota bacterium]